MKKSQKRTSTEKFQHQADRRGTEREHLNCGKCHFTYLLTKICDRFLRIDHTTDEDWKLAQKLHQRLWTHSKYSRYWRELAKRGLRQNQIDEEFKARGWGI